MKSGFYLLLIWLGLLVLSTLSTQAQSHDYLADSIVYVMDAAHYDLDEMLITVD